MKQELLQYKSSIGQFIKAIAELNEDYVIQDNGIHRFKKKYKLSHYISEILKDNPDGLHFRQITEQIKLKYGIDVPERKVHAHLSKTGNFDQFINIGLGIYTIKGTGEYSGEKTPDLIYGFLKESNVPKTLNDIQEYVTKRKKVELKTIRVALDYPKEFRFCFYKDGTIGLKEWNLGNERKKVRAKIYDISLNDALYELIKDGVLKKGENYDRSMIKGMILQHFPGQELSDNNGAVYRVLENYVDKRILGKKSLSDKNIYFLI